MVKIIAYYKHPFNLIFGDGINFSQYFAEMLNIPRVERDARSDDVQFLYFAASVFRSTVTGIKLSTYHVFSQKGFGRHR